MGLTRIELCRKLEAKPLPPRLSRECLLLGTGIKMGSVNFVVTMPLEVLEDDSKLVEVGNTRAAFDVWADGRKTQDDLL
jgi:hypothetical protein